MPPSILNRVPTPTERTLLLLGLFIACLLMVAVGVWAAQPYRDAAQVEVKNAALESELLRTSRSAELARRDASRLLLPSGTEDEARRLGYVRVGQVPLMIPGDPERQARGATDAP